MSTDYCDCGSAIPEGASFCPGCGKPLTPEARENERRANAFPRPRVSEEDQEETPQGPLKRVTFATPGALRSCYWSAAFAAILISVPFGMLLSFLIFPAAGFYSVYSFRRQTKRDVTPAAGAKLGFLTGTITFALILILFTIVSVMPSLPPSDVGLWDSWEEQLQQQGEIEAAEQLRQVRENPTTLALAVLIGLAFLFVLTTSFTTAGGALGAKVLEKE